MPTDDEVVADFIRRFDRGDFEGRFMDEMARLSLAQLERVSQILLKERHKPSACKDE